MLFIGCHSIQARTYLALALHRKTPQQVCADYLKAYYHQASVFKLKHIERAVNACLLAQDYETARSFLGFQDRYREAHPGEALQRPAWVEDQTRTLTKTARPTPLRIPTTGTKPSVRNSA